MHRNYADLCRDRPVLTTTALGAWLYVWFLGIYTVASLFNWGAPAMLPHEYVAFGGTPALDLIVLHATYAILALLGAIAFNDYADFFIAYAEDRLGLNEDSLASTFR